MKIFVVNQHYNRRIRSSKIEVQVMTMSVMHRGRSYWNGIHWLFYGSLIYVDETVCHRFFSPNERFTPAHRYHPILKGFHPILEKRESSVYEMTIQWGIGVFPFKKWEKIESEMRSDSYYQKMTVHNPRFFQSKRQSSKWQTCVTGIAWQNDGKESRMGGKNYSNFTILFSFEKWFIILISPF